MDIESRVQKIENGQTELTQAFRDFSKDFHHLSETIFEVKEVLKIMAKTETELVLFRQEFRSHVEMEDRRMLDAHKRIESIEKNVNRVTWLVVATVLGAVVKLVVIGG
jgi:cysteinyl-tRNA synthetase